MRKKILLYLILSLGLQLYPVRAVEYPIIFLGANTGYTRNELTSALAIRGMFRYSFEAYIPGFQIECSYATQLFKTLADTTIRVNREEEKIYETKISDHQLAISGLLQLRPFGKSPVLYLGGGGNLSYLSCDSTWKEKYWDPEIDDFQELKHDPVNLLRTFTPGYHYFGGIRFLFGDIGSLDFEVRQVMLPVAESEWKFERFAARYGAKKWDNLSFTLGITINIY